jgi:5-methyltetrahydrofolate--homocysteine methyltransferase
VLDRLTLLDGAMGTALLDRGLPPGALPEAWILSRPAEIAAVHAAHAAAGARILLTCTFNVTAPRLETCVEEARIEALCGWAERLARSAGRGLIVAGDLGPTGLAGPGLPAPSSAELAERYARPSRALAAAGVDLLWIESQWDLGEALAALAAARHTGLPAAVTFTFRDEEGRLSAADGTPAAECLAAVAAGGAAAAGVNCGAAGDALTALAAHAREHLDIPFVAKPSAGLPGAILPPERFAAAVAQAIRAGARLAGGCCGAGPDHLEALWALVGR